MTIEITDEMVELAVDAFLSTNPANYTTVGFKGVRAALEAALPVIETAVRAECESDDAESVEYGRAQNRRIRALDSRIAELETELGLRDEELRLCHAELAKAKAALAGAEGGEWSAADYHAARAAAQRCTVDGGDWDDQVRASLDAVKHRLAPAKPVEGGTLVADDLNQMREAEELRKGIETYQETLRQRMLSRIDTNKVVDALQCILDEVDARDSLAYLENQGEAQEPAHEVYCSACDCQHKASACSQEPAQPPAGWQYASPADALRPNDRHGLVEAQPTECELATELFGDYRPAQPAEVADVLTAEERELLYLADDCLCSDAVTVDGLVRAVRRLASELAKERKRVDVMDRLASELEGELAKLRNRVRGVVTQTNASTLRSAARCLQDGLESTYLAIQTRALADRIDAALKGGSHG
jgi:hypothetical protein